MIGQRDLVYGNLEYQVNGNQITFHDNFNQVILYKDDTACWIGTDDNNSYWFYFIQFDNTGFIHNGKHIDFSRVKLVAI